MPLNPTNNCASLVINQIDIENPFAEMYILQKRLQLRLNDCCYNHIDAKTAASKVIYWYFCIADECKELMDWFKPENHVDKTHGELDQEVKMEAIDVLHFVMNIGLEFNISPDDVAIFESTFIHNVTPPMIPACTKSIKTLSDTCIDLIDMCPWKTWKTYDDFTIEEYTPIILPYFEKVYKAALALCNGVNLGRQDIVNFYFSKNAENHNRQNNGY